MDIHVHWPFVFKNSLERDTFWQLIRKRVHYETCSLASEKRKVWQSWSSIRIMGCSCVHLHSKSILTFYSLLRKRWRLVFCESERCRPNACSWFVLVASKGGFCFAAVVSVRGREHDRWASLRNWRMEWQEIGIVHLIASCMASCTSSCASTAFGFLSRARFIWSLRLSPRSVSCRKPQNLQLRTKCFQ